MSLTRRSQVGLPLWWLRGGLLPDGGDLATVQERYLAQGLYVGADAAVTGTVAVSSAAPTGAVIGTPVVAGEASANAAAPTATSAGAPALTGTAAASVASPSVTATGGATATLLVELLEGTTSRASWTVYPAAVTTSNLTLTTGERNSLGNWGDLRLRVTKSGAQVDVLDVSLETPAAVSATTGTVSVSAAAPTVSASGTPLVSGSSASAVEASTVSAQGGPISTGSVAASVPAPTGSADGTTRITGTGVVTSATPTASVAGTPVTTSTVAVVSVAPVVSAANSATATVVVDLLEGTTVRASATIYPTTLTTTEVVLSTPERDAIGNWANLRIRVTKSGAQVDVVEASLATPAVGATGTVTATVNAPTTAIAAGSITGTVGASVAAPTVAASAPNPPLTVEVLEGATVRASRTILAPATPITESLVLSAGEAASIGDWSALRVRLTQRGAQIRVFDIELDAPDGVGVAGSVAVATPPPTLALTGTVWAVGSASAIAPPPSASASGTLTLVGSVAATASAALTFVNGTPVVVVGVSATTPPPTTRVINRKQNQWEKTVRVELANTTLTLTALPSSSLALPTLPSSALTTPSLPPSTDLA